MVTKQPRLQVTTKVRVLLPIWINRVSRNEAIHLITRKDTTTTQLTRDIMGIVTQVTKEAMHMTTLVTRPPMDTTTPATREAMHMITQVTRLIMATTTQVTKKAMHMITQLTSSTGNHSLKATPNKPATIPTSNNIRMVQIQGHITRDST